VKSTLQHGPPAKDRVQVDGCGWNSENRGEEKQSNAATDDGCLRRGNTIVTHAPGDDRSVRHANVPIATRHDDDTSATRQVDAERRTLQRSTATSGCRSRRHQRDSRVDVPAEQAVAQCANNLRRLRDIRHSAGATGNVQTRDGREPTAGDNNHQQSAADCTDQLTTDIYTSLAAFQDVQENDVIDAVRGYLQSRQPPTPSSSSRHLQRPLTAGRRPATAATAAAAAAGSRTVELRQGDVGPLSSLVVIRPATPQPRPSIRADGRPSAPTPSDGGPNTAAVAAAASGGGRSALCHDPRRSHHHHHHQQQQQQQQQQRCVVQTLSRATAETTTAACRSCRTQLLNKSIYINDGFA